MSSAVISPYPLWNSTPGRMLKVQVTKSSEILQDSASMGAAFRFLSNRTRASPIVVLTTYMAGLPAIDG